MKARAGVLGIDKPISHWTCFRLCSWGKARLSALQHPAMPQNLPLRIRTVQRDESSSELGANSIIQPLGEMLERMSAFFVILIHTEHWFCGQGAQEPFDGNMTQTSMESVWFCSQGCAREASVPTPCCAFREDFLIFEFIYY